MFSLNYFGASNLHLNFHVLPPLQKDLLTSFAYCLPHVLTRHRKEGFHQVFGLPTPLILHDFSTSSLPFEASFSVRPNEDSWFV